MSFAASWNYFVSASLNLWFNLGRGLWQNLTQELVEWKRAPHCLTNLMATCKVSTPAHFLSRQRRMGGHLSDSLKGCFSCWDVPSPNCDVTKFIWGPKSRLGKLFWVPPVLLTALKWIILNTRGSLIYFIQWGTSNPVSSFHLDHLRWKWSAP